MQTLKDFQSGRLLVYILADFVAVSEKAVEQDEAAVRGVIANKPTYRETPRGKRITDITVKVRNELTGGSCFYRASAGRNRQTRRRSGSRATL